METLEQRFAVDSVTTEKYLRVASISIVFYDYILTLPAEWRFYRSQSSFLHMSLACALFILIRYFSIMTIVASNYGYFSTAYTLQTCQHYYLVAPAFKAVQTMVSQAILGVRTFNVARRSRQIGVVLLLLYLFSISAEWFSNMFHRTAVVLDGNCTPADTGKILSTWFYYLAMIVYDIVMVTISTMHLLRYNPLSSRVQQLVRVLIYDGIGYFVVLSAANILNLVLYRRGGIETQSAGVSIGYAVTWIMSQRILINVREPDTQRFEDVIIPQDKVTPGVRSQFKPRRYSKRSSNHRSLIDAELGPQSSHNPKDMELDIHVSVEHLVVVDYINESERSSS
ncbi:hypothetical protein BDR07DRAFT_1457162 [Suillus spraguei]|nr:hypothetical protein BDR07DRAFT_1457162 [Suillus spraguei]